MKKGRFSAHLHFFQMHYIIWMQDRWREREDEEEEGEVVWGFFKLNTTSLFLQHRLTPHVLMHDGMESRSTFCWQAARLPSASEALNVLMWSAGSGGIMENCVRLVSHDCVGGMNNLWNKKMCVCFIPWHTTHNVSPLGKHWHMSCIKRIENWSKLARIKWNTK